MGVVGQHPTNYSFQSKQGRLGSLWAVPVFLLLMLIGHLLHSQLTQPLYYGGFVVNTGQNTQLEFLRQGDVSLQACKEKTSQIVAVYRGLCPQCKVEQTPCSEAPSTQNLGALSEAAIELPSARTQGGGTLVYRSANREDALTLCNQTGVIDPSLKCLQPGEARPLPAQEFSAKTPGMRADRLVLRVIAVLALLLALMTALLYTQKRSASLPFAKGQTVQKFILASADLLALMLAFYLVGLPSEISPILLYQYDLRQVALQFLLGLAVIGWLWVHYQQYTRRRPLWDELRELFKTLVAATLISATTLFYSGVQASRDLNIWAWALCFLLVPIGRIAARQCLHVFGLWMRPALIIGTGPNAVDAYKAIRSEFSLGYQIVGFVEPDTGSLMKTTHLEVDGQFYKKYRYDTAFSDTLLRLHAPQLVLALESMADTSAQSLLHKLSLISDNVHVIPSLRGLPLFGAQVSHFFSHEVVFLTVRNNLSRRSYQLIKRSFDVLLAGIAMVLLSPLFLVLVYLIRQDGGAAFYGHSRIGKNGKAFKCLKFRSMHADSERMLKKILATDPLAKAEWDKDFKLRNDPRITKVGRFLRKTSIDELPQLINVLKGEMSLVGPRPIVQAELERYGNSSTYYLSVLPGITGLWQVSGRNDTSYKERVALDAWYAQNWSMWYDIAIMFKTIGVVFARKGAY